MTTESHNPSTTGYHENAVTTPASRNSTARVAADQNDGIEVRIEFVVLDGPEGTQLNALQAEAVRRILRALHRARTATSKVDPR
jgi:hypothetical protein